MVESETAAVVCDAGPLIHLDELRSLALLAMFSAVYVPGAVWEEVQRHRPSALRHRQVALNRVQDVPEVDASLSLVLQDPPLDPGEEEALRLMTRFPGAILLTDDRAARSACEKLGRAVHGTIGVILEVGRQGRKTKRQVLNLLRAVPARSTLHIRRRALEEVIMRVQRGAFP